MAVIEVNHESIRNMANCIDEYCTMQKQTMNNLNQTVEATLLSEWTGQDAAEYGNKWSELDNSQSTTEIFRRSLEAYADALRACADKYKQTQAEIYNLSVLLNNW